MPTRGDKGDTGRDGIQGLTGETGIQGITGDAGQKGLRGATGETGDAGQKGSTGETGIQGVAGLQGLPGKRGLIGETGPDGRTGHDGEVGIRGVEGARGFSGVQGQTGHTGVDGQRGARGKTGTVQTKLDRYALFIVVVVTAVSAIYFATVSQHRLTDANHLIQSGIAQQKATDRSATCRQRIFEETVVALKARSTFAEIQAQSLLTLDTAQQKYLAAVIEPGITREQALTALDTYQQALDFSIHATHDQLAIHDRHPYPTVADVRSCR